MSSKSTEPRRRAIYGITRVDDEKKHTHCWIVHIERRRRVWHRSFSDGVYGGKTNALRAARAFRDEILVSHLPMTRAEYAAIRRKNNRSGFPGVTAAAAMSGDLGKAGRASLLDRLLADAGRQAGDPQVLNREVRRKDRFQACQGRAEASARIDGRATCELAEAEEVAATARCHLEAARHQRAACGLPLEWLVTRPQIGEERRDRDQRRR